MIYDDMIRTGGSLKQAATAYLDAGATGVSAVATHGVFPEGAQEILGEGGLLRKVVVTDSHPAALRERGGLIEVVTVADLLADEIERGLP